MIEWYMFGPDDELTDEDLDNVSGGGNPGDGGQDDD